MFKRYRRVLIRYGLNGNIALFEHFCENMFFVALITAKSIVWSNQNGAWLFYHGPIICFLFVTITESINLFNWRDLLEDKDINSNSTDHSKSISEHGNEIENNENNEKLKDLKTKVDESLWERIERVNLNFFDITATIIIYVSLLGFLSEYSFGDSKEEGRTGCVLGHEQTYDDDYGYYYDDADGRWFNGTFGQYDDDAYFDDEYKKKHKKDPAEGGEEVDEAIEWLFMFFLFAEVCGSIGELNPATSMPLIYYGLTASLCATSTRSKTEFYFAIILTPIIIIFYLLDLRHLSCFNGYGKVGLFIFPITFLTQLLIIFCYPFFACIAFVYLMLFQYCGDGHKSLSVILMPFEKNPAIYYNDLICMQGNHRIVDYFIKVFINYKKKGQGLIRGKGADDFELSGKDVYNPQLIETSNEKIQQLHELRISKQGVDGNAHV